MQNGAFSCIREGDVVVLSKELCLEQVWHLWELIKVIAHDHTEPRHGIQSVVQVNLIKEVLSLLCSEKLDDLKFKWYSFHSEN